jgi:HPt (histidine-containing phosphotransfer) domain-containing protein
MTAGMDGYLSKPIRPQELDEILDTYLAIDREASPIVESYDPPNHAVCADELLERIDGDQAFLAELLELFRAESPEQIRAARKAVAENDAAALQEVGHALKGALGNLAAAAASTIASGLESMGKTGDMALAGTRVTELEQELTRVIETLEGMCLETVQ